MTGTTMAIMDLLGGNISAFKWEEIALVLSVGPFTGEQVGEIIHHYFPKLEVKPSVANRWAGRGRICFSVYLNLFLRMHVELTIIRVFRYLSIEGILILKEWFNKNEIECYRDAVNMIQDYIGSYEKKYSMVKVEKNDNDTMIHLLEDIYHDLIMRHSNRRKRAVIFDVGVDLVNAGIALLPQKYKGKHKHI
jgi:hypothetical protein